MRGDRALRTGVSAAVLVVFGVAALLVTSAARVALAVAGALMAGGSWMLLSSLGVPGRVPAIDVDALVGADATLREAAEAVNGMAARIDEARAADEPAGIAEESNTMRELVASMADLVSLPELSSASAGEDRALVLSLASTWLPSAWEQLETNVRYLGFGGRAGTRARGNVAALEEQCASVAGALDRIRTNVVSDASVRVETGSDYLRQRLGHRPSELSLDDPGDGRG